MAGTGGVRTGQQRAVVAHLSGLRRAIHEDAVPASAAGGRRRSSLGALYVLVLGSFIVALLAIDISQAAHTSFGWDFRAFYDGGRSYLHLESPYVSGALADLTSRQNFVYPLPTAALFAPVSLLPYQLAAALFVCLSAVLLVAALRIVGVRDLRCYAAVLVSAPVLDGLEIGTISPILVFLTAVIWRYRNRTWVVALALSLAVLTKLFLWPLAVWLLATSRFKSLVASGAIVVGAVAVSAAPLGVGVVKHYPHLLKTVSDFEGPSSLSLVGLGTAVTGSTAVGSILSLACGALVLLSVVWWGRRGDESRSFRLAILASLVLTPIVWNHYLVLLFVPLAMVRPRFSPIWLGIAWVLGAVHGDALAGVALAVAVVAVWGVVVAQTGVLRHGADGMSASLLARGVASPLVRLGGVVALCAAVVSVLVALSGVVPAVAALRGVGPSNGASGTANLRLLRSGSVCTTVVTTGVPATATVQLVDVERSTVLFERDLTGSRSTACGRYRRAGLGTDLADAFSEDRAKLSLRVVSKPGRVILSGSVVHPTDAGQRPQPVGRRSKTATPSAS